MDDSPELVWEDRPKRSRAIFPLVISQLFTIGCLFWVILTSTRTVESKQEIIDSYQDLVRTYQKSLDLRDGLLDHKDSIIGKKDLTIKSYVRITRRYEKMADEYINHLKKENRNAKILLTNARQQ